MDEVFGFRFDVTLHSFWQFLLKSIKGKQTCQFIILMTVVWSVKITSNCLPYITELPVEYTYMHTSRLVIK